MSKGIVIRNTGSCTYHVADGTTVGYGKGKEVMPPIGAEVEYEDVEGKSFPQHVRIISSPGYSGPNSIETSVPIEDADRTMQDRYDEHMKRQKENEALRYDFVSDRNELIKWANDRGLPFNVTRYDLEYRKSEVDSIHPPDKPPEAYTAERKKVTAVGYDGPNSFTIAVPNLRLDFKDWWIVRAAGWATLIGSLATVLWNVS